MENSCVVINKQGIIQSVNAATVALFGYKDATELVGKPVAILMPSPYKEQHQKYVDNYENTRNAKVIGKSRVVEGSTKDGSIFPIRLSVSELSRDAEDTYYCALIQPLELCVPMITTNEKGIILSTNKETCTLFGYKDGELIGKNVSVICEDAHAKYHDSYIARYLETGEKRAIGRARNVKAKKKDGTTFAICLEVSERTEGGNRVFVGKVNEVTEETEATINIDEDGTILSSSSQGCWLLFGYTQEDLIGKNINILMTYPHK